MLHAHAADVNADAGDVQEAAAARPAARAQTACAHIQKAVHHLELAGAELLGIPNLPGASAFQFGKHTDRASEHLLECGAIARKLARWFEAGAQGRLV